MKKKKKRSEFKISKWRGTQHSNLDEHSNYWLVVSGNFQVLIGTCIIQFQNFDFWHHFPSNFSSTWNLKSNPSQSIWGGLHAYHKASKFKAPQSPRALGGNNWEWLLCNLWSFIWFCDQVFQYFPSKILVKFPPLLFYFCSYYF